MPRKTLKSAPLLWYVTSFSQWGRWNVADSAEMAANMPTTWATMAGQKTPPEFQYSEVAPGVLQLARHVAEAAQRPVDQEDGAPRRDPDDHDVDEVLQVRRERGAEDGVHGDAERNDAVDEHGLVALHRERRWPAA